MGNIKSSLITSTLKITEEAKGSKLITMEEGKYRRIRKITHTIRHTSNNKGIRRLRSINPILIISKKECKTNLETTTPKINKEEWNSILK